LSNIFWRLSWLWFCLKVFDEGVNLTAAQVSDQIVEEFIEDAVAALLTQTGQTINPSNCSTSEAVAVKTLQPSTVPVEQRAVLLAD
jgi:hypothetical protein